MVLQSRWDWHAPGEETYVRFLHLVHRKNTQPHPAQRTGTSEAQNEHHAIEMHARLFIETIVLEYRIENTDQCANWEPIPFT